MERSPGAARRRRPRTAVAVTATYPAVTGLDDFPLLKPVIVLDGALIPATDWGRNAFPVSPGRHHLRVYTSNVTWPRELGPADLSVTVTQGEVMELVYRKPLGPLADGFLGPLTDDPGDPSLRLWIAAAVLVTCVIVIAIVSTFWS